MKENRSLKLARSFLGKEITITIDRPLGTKHPKWDYTYPINYGYIKDVTAPDGEDLDSYILGVDDPRESFTGICVAIIHRNDDDDDKLVVTPKNFEISDTDIMNQVAFQEKWFDSLVIRK